MMNAPTSAAATSPEATDSQQIVAVCQTSMTAPYVLVTCATA